MMYRGGRGCWDNLIITQKRERPPTEDHKIYTAKHKGEKEKVDRLG